MYIKKIICIDPGHGDPDPGTIFDIYKESIIVLNVANALTHQLERRGYISMLTRYTDSALIPLPGKRAKIEDLAKRTALANTFKADLFISLHVNAFKTSAASGTETWCYKKSKNGFMLATAIQESLIQEFGLEDRGVKKGRFAVLKKTHMPAALTEFGFLTNSADRELLISPEFTERAAIAIADGVDLYFRRKVA